MRLLERSAVSLGKSEKVCSAEISIKSKEQLYRLTFQMNPSIYLVKGTTQNHSKGTRDLIWV